MTVCNACGDPLFTCVTGPVTWLTISVIWKVSLPFWCGKGLKYLLEVNRTLLIFDLIIIL